MLSAPPYIQSTLYGFTRLDLDSVLDIGFNVTCKFAAVVAIAPGSSVSMVGRDSEGLDLLLTNQIYTQSRPLSSIFPAYHFPTNHALFSADVRPGFFYGRVFLSSNSSRGPPSQHELMLQSRFWSEIVDPLLSLFIKCLKKSFSMRFSLPTVCPFFKSSILFVRSIFCQD